MIKDRVRDPVERDSVQLHEIEPVRTTERQRGEESRRTVARLADVEWNVDSGVLIPWPIPKAG